MKQLSFATGLALAGLLALTGCESAQKEKSPSVFLSMGETITQIEITHQEAGQTSQWVVDGSQADVLWDWVLELEYSPAAFEDGQSPGDADGGETYDFRLNDKEKGEFCYVINGKADCYLLIEGDWYTVSNPSNPPVQEPDSKSLTLEKVIALSEKGQELTWDDFEGYPYEDIGSGLYIQRYPVGESYYLLIGGVPNQKPFYIRLQRVGETDEFIDIRTDSVKDFLERWDGK